MTPGNEKRIGELNGPWALMLKVALVTYGPVVVGSIGWLSWVTASIFSLEGERKARDLSERMDSSVLAEMRSSIRQMQSDLTEVRIALATVKFPTQKTDPSMK